MGAWVTGHNLAGYMPESDTYAYETWKEAVAGMVADAQDYADTDDEHHNGMADETWTDEDYGSMRATVDAILADDGPREEGKSWSMWVADSDDRRIVFWLQWEATRDADEEN
jgi:hypothetical protein